MHYAQAPIELCKIRDEVEWVMDNYTTSEAGSRKIKKYTMIKDGHKLDMSCLTNYSSRQHRRCSEVSVSRTERFPL